MAAHIAQPTRSRRFIKVYLSMWALLASGALAYLAVLAFPPQALRPAQASLDPAAETARGGTSADSEARGVKGSLSEIRKDVTQLQEVVGERVINEKVVETRLTALEDRVSTIDGQPQPAGAPGINVREKVSRGPGEPPFKPVAEEPATAPAAAAQIETGSIGPKDEIVFGEAVVTRAGAPELAVQVAAGPSLQELKLSWGQLTERHGSALATLKPRIVPPARGKGTYRLLAGPVATEADAQRICSELGVGPKTCFATPYAGTPL
jgi:sporulation related protein